MWAIGPVLSKLTNSLRRIRVNLKGCPRHDEEDEDKNGKELRPRDRLDRAREGEKGTKDEGRSLSRREGQTMAEESNTTTAPAKQRVSPKLTTRPIRVVDPSWPHANRRSRANAGEEEAMRGWGNVHKRDVEPTQPKASLRRGKADSLSAQCLGIPHRRLIKICIAVATPERMHRITAIRPTPGTPVRNLRIGQSNALREPKTAGEDALEGPSRLNVSRLAKGAQQAKGGGIRNPQPLRQPGALIVCSRPAPIETQSILRNTLSKCRPVLPGVNGTFSPFRGVPHRRGRG